MRRLFKPMASPLGPVILASCIAAALTVPAEGTQPVSPAGLCSKVISDESKA